MIDASAEMMLAGGRPIPAQNVSIGHTILGLSGPTPRPMIVLALTKKKTPDAISITAGGHVVTVSPDAMIYCENSKRRADELWISDSIRIFDDILHCVAVESLERLEGEFRMFDFQCDGRASFLIADGFLVR